MSNKTYAQDTTNRTTTTTASRGDSTIYQNVYLYSVFGYLTDINQTGTNLTSKSVTYTYNANGQRVGSTNKQSGETVLNSAWSYDAANRVTSIQHKTATDNLFADYGFTWDAVNRITAFETNDGTTDYTYDATGQLIAADDNFIADESYEYDENGNRVTANGDTYTTGANNETVSDGTYQYTYDSEGNRTEKFLWTDANEDGIIDDNEKTLVQTYEWDYRNRLTSVTNYENGLESEVVSYTYDYLNQMLSRSITIDSTTTTESYLYDNGQIAVQFDNTGNISAVNLWGANIDELVAVERLAQSTNESNEVLWSHGDHLNSVRYVTIYNLTTDTTTVINHLIYDAFGNLVSSVDPSQVNSPSIEPILVFRYTGKYFDDSTGLQNNLNRWYDSTTGKWLSVDPIGFEGGDLNLYRYVSNNSVLLFDPKGESCLGCKYNLPLKGVFYDIFASGDVTLGFANTYDIKSIIYKYDSEIEQLLQKATYLGGAISIPVQVQKMMINQKIRLEIDKEIRKNYKKHFETPVTITKCSPGIKFMPDGYAVPSWTTPVGWYSDNYIDRFTAHFNYNITSGNVTAGASGHIEVVVELNITALLQLSYYEVHCHECISKTILENNELKDYYYMMTELLPVLQSMKGTP